MAVLIDPKRSRLWARSGRWPRWPRPRSQPAFRPSWKRIVFTVEQRDALRDRMLALAQDDNRVVAGAAVGSLALGGGDHHSDLDLTFAVADDVPIAEVLDDWTRTLGDELDAVPLVDLERGPTI